MSSKQWSYTLGVCSLGRVGGFCGSRAWSLWGWLRLEFLSMFLATNAIFLTFERYGRYVETHRFLPCQTKVRVHCLLGIEIFAPPPKPKFTFCNSKRTHKFNRPPHCSVQDKLAVNKFFAPIHILCVSSNRINWIKRGFWTDGSTKTVDLLHV